VARCARLGKEVGKKVGKFDQGRNKKSPRSSFRISDLQNAENAGEVGKILGNIRFPSLCLEPSVSLAWFGELRDH